MKFKKTVAFLCTIAMTSQFALFSYAEEVKKNENSNVTIENEELYSISRENGLDGDIKVLASGECGANGDNLIWEYSSDNKLTISGVGEMADYYSANPSPWSDFKDEIKSLCIAEGVTYIGDMAFYYHDEINGEITLPNSLVAIGSNAFGYCSEIDGELYLPDSLISLGSDAFYGCKDIYSLRLTENTSWFGGGVFENTSIDHIVYTGNKESFENKFRYDINQFEFSIIHYETNKINYDITEGINPTCTESGRTESKSCPLCGDTVRWADYVSPMGHQWEKEYTIDKPATDTEPGLKSIHCSLCDVQDSTSIEVIPTETGVIEVGTIGNDRYWSLTKDGVLTISGVGYFSTQKDKQSKWWYDYKIKKVIIEEGITEIGSYEFKSCKTIESVEFPSTLYYIGREAFYGCDVLKEIHLPENINQIESDAFNGCNDIYFTVKKDCTLGSGIFFGCNLYLTISSSIKEIKQDSFEWKAGATIKSITLEEGITEIQNKGLASASNDIETIVLPRSLESIYEDAFLYCDELKSIIFLNPKTVIKSWWYDSQFSFTGCTIYGYSGSTAEKMANLNSLTFVPIEHECIYDGPIEEQQKSTCITQGVSRQLCSICLYNYVELPIPFAEHRWESFFTTDKKATCTEDGSKSYHCITDGCNAKNEITTIEKLGHSYDKGELISEPSCKETGKKIFTCMTCGDTKIEELEKRDHVWTQWQISQEINDRGVGIKTRYCKNCDVEPEVIGFVDESFKGTSQQLVYGESYHFVHGFNLNTNQCACSVSIIDDHRVVLGQTVYIPFYESDNHIDSYMVKDEVKFYEYGGKGSEYSYIVSDSEIEIFYKDDFKTENTLMLKLVICKDGSLAIVESKYTDTHFPIGASLINGCTENIHFCEVLDIEPTCEEAGGKKEVCIYCKQFQWLECIEATGHDWSEWIIVKENSYDEDGKEERSCLKCSKYEERIIPKKQLIEEVFADVLPGKWFYSAVSWAYENGFLTGTSSSEFTPNGHMTRGMLVTVLYRMEGRPLVTESNRFPDVSEKKYYASAITWASSLGLVAGYKDGTFGPEDSITREQIAKILYLYAESKGYDVTASTDISDFKDASKVASYARKYMEWAVAEGLIKGSSGNLNPKGNATRAEIAAILKRFVESYQ